MLENIRRGVWNISADEGGLRGRLVVIYAALAILNGGGWIWAFACFGNRPDLLGIALVVYGLGLRHAVDADHIAAIDNVTRKLMQEKQQPVAVGFFFAMGHSAVVVLATAAVALVAGLAESLQTVREIGGLIGTSVSALFLLAIAAMNLAVFFSVYQTYRRVKLGASPREEELDLILNHSWFARLCRPLFKLVTRSYHMVLLGFLFGLGFDTATEVAMFGISAAQAAKGLSVLAVLVFPLLFAAGMALADTTDGVMMLGAYRWAAVKPMRKLRYNMTITLMSVLVATVVGALETLNLLKDRFLLVGRFWDKIGTVNDSFQLVGAGIVVVFAAIWVGSLLIARFNDPAEIDLRPAN